MVDIRTREQWGGDNVDLRHVAPSKRTEFFVHYDGQYHITHLGDSIMHRLERIHAGNGWKAVGYNFVVDQQGNAYEGRGWDYSGAHCPGHNVSGIGVQVAIGGDQTPSKAALKTVRALYDEACARSGRELKKRGHRDGKATACPGEKLYAWVKAGFPARAGANPPAVLPPVTPDKSTDQLVKEVLAGSHGSGDMRKRSLGDRYAEVQAAVNAHLGVNTAPAAPPAAPARKSTQELANEVIAGLHGTGVARKRSLGYRYGEVQLLVNQQITGDTAPRKSIADLAQEVIDGKHGNGPARRQSLGSSYARVQREVNRRLR